MSGPQGRRHAGDLRVEAGDDHEQAAVRAVQKRDRPAEQTEGQAQHHPDGGLGGARVPRGRTQAAAAAAEGGDGARGPGLEQVPAAGARPESRLNQKILVANARSRAGDARSTHRAQRPETVELSISERAVEADRLRYGRTQKNVGIQESILSMKRKTPLEVVI